MREVKRFLEHTGSPQFSKKGNTSLDTLWWPLEKNEYISMFSAIFYKEESLSLEENKLSYLLF